MARPADSGVRDIHMRRAVRGGVGATQLDSDDEVAYGGDASGSDTEPERRGRPEGTPVTTVRRQATTGAKISSF